MTSPRGVQPMYKASNGRLSMEIPHPNTPVDALFLLRIISGRAKSEGRGSGAPLLEQDAEAKLTDFESLKAH